MNAKVPPSNRRFGKQDRVITQADFDKVHRSQWFAADRTLVVKGVQNQQNVTRLGLSVSRKVGNAVVRNRWKRMIREAFRNQRSVLPESWDFVVRPRKGAQLDYREIADSLCRLSQKIARQPKK